MAPPYDKGTPSFITQKFLNKELVAPKDWGRQMQIAKWLAKLYPKKIFWEQLKLPSKVSELSSLMFFYTDWGKKILHSNEANLRPTKPVEKPKEQEFVPITPVELKATCLTDYLKYGDKRPE